MMPEHAETVRGKAVLPYLSELYPQLFLVPGDEGAQEYKNVVTKGQTPTHQTLEHFRTSENDVCSCEQTPAGAVRVVTLHERADFETFLRIMANRCTLCEIPRTQGASFLNGVISWGRIRAHQAAWLEAERSRGMSSPDWGAEFQRFTADKGNYLDSLVVLSVGPYSGVDGAVFGLEADEWLRFSHDIRKYHECTHFICRRLFPDQKDPIWDELIADAVGIYAAVGRYDLQMAETFLGVDAQGYHGGRLENYIAGGEDIDAQAARVYAALHKLDAAIRASAGVEPYALAVLLEEQKSTLWS